MKTTLTLIAIIAGVGLASSLHASPLPDRTKNETHLPIDKNNITRETYLRLNEVDIHAARHFMKQFSNVTDAKWLRIDGGYLVRFTNEGNRNDAFYDNRGRFIQSSSYFRENDSPAEIKELINKTFPGYTIMVTTKISVGSKTYYRLHISNPNFIKTLEVINAKIYVREDQLNGATVNQ